MAEITIPSNAFLPCPAISFRNRQATACVTCDHFAGVVDTQPKAPDAPVHQRFRIGCAHPVARRFDLIEVAHAGTE